MERLDRKFNIKATHTNKKRFHDEFDSVLFLAKDNLLLPTLLYYKRQCKKHGVSEKQIKGVGLLIERVLEWRAINSKKCKLPDIERGEEEKFVNKPNK